MEPIKPFDRIEKAWLSAINNMAIILDEGQYYIINIVNQKPSNPTPLNDQHDIIIDEKNSLIVTSTKDDSAIFIEKESAYLTLSEIKNQLIQEYNNFIIIKLLQRIFDKQTSINTKINDLHGCEQMLTSNPELAKYVLPKIPLFLSVEKLDIINNLEKEIKNLPLTTELLNAIKCETKKIES